MAKSDGRRDPLNWDDIIQYLNVHVLPHRRAVGIRMKTEKFSFRPPASFVEEWTNRPWERWSSVANLDLAEAVGTFAASRSYLALSDRRFLMSLALLMKRAAESRSPAERSEAQSHLERALRGFHVPSLLTRGKPRHVVNQTLAIQADNVSEYLQTCAKYQNNPVARLAAIRGRFPGLSNQESQRVSDLLRRPRNPKRLRLRDATLLVLSNLHRRSESVLKKELYRSRRHVGYAQYLLEKGAQPAEVSGVDLDGLSDNALMLLAMIAERPDAE
jgi:hypothetical protein